MLVTIIGPPALTSLSYIPQLKKALPADSTDDLTSTLAAFAAGLALWIGYGVLNSCSVIIVANAVGLALVATLIGLKIRDSR